MLSNTLSIIKIVIQEQFKDKSIDIPKTLKFFSHYKKEDWIYPGVLKRRLKIDIKDVYKFLYLLEKHHIIQNYYELYCSHCQKTMGLVELFSDLPETFECELCHTELNTLENAFIIYKVIRDD